jgi:hypothetical protein
MLSGKGLNMSKIWRLIFNFAPSMSNSQPNGACCAGVGVFNECFFDYFRQGVWRVVRAQLDLSVNKPR